MLLECAMLQILQRLLYFQQATLKKNMIKQGLLGKYGKPNEKTPAAYLEGNPDFRYLLSFIWRCLQQL